MMRRAMRVMTASVFSLGLLAVVSSGEDRTHVRDAKGSAVSFHAASSQPAPGMRKETLASGEVVYVSPTPVANGMDILDAADGRDGLSLQLSGNALGRLQRQGEQLAVMVGSKVVSAAPIMRDGQVIFGDLTPENADRITRLVHAQPTVPVGGPLLTVVPAGTRDGLYLVDVFVQGVDDLRTYQISLQTGGGVSGSLELAEVYPDATRQDYVFGTQAMIDASATRTGKLIGVLYDGSVDASSPKYLGTYAFRPSADAGGTFRINIDLGIETLLANAENIQTTYSTGADARITIGSPRSPRNTE